MDRVEHLERGSSKRGEERALPEESKKEAPIPQLHQEVEAKKEVTLEMVMSEISSRNQKINALKEEMSGANKKLEEFERVVLLSNARLDVLEQELSKMVRRVEETEETSSILQKRAVRVSA